MAEEELRMSFWSHLTELRKRIVYSAIAIGAGFLVCFNYSEEILGLLLLPMNSTMTFHASAPFLHFEPNKTTQELYFTTLIEPIMSHLKIGFIAGIMLMVPIILFQIWKFISPGLLPRERKYAGQFKVGTLGEANYVRLDVLPGRYVLSVTPFSLAPAFLRGTPESVTVEAEASHCYFLRALWTQDERNWRSFRIYLGRVTEEEGEREVNVRTLILPTQ